MKLRYFLIVVMCVLLTSQACNRKQGCATFDEKTGKPNLPKGNKREPNQLFGKKMDKYQNSSNKRRRPSKSKEDKTIMGN
jgi:hypothetical protein